MVRLATELDSAGHAFPHSDPTDARTHALQLTKRWKRLMLDSFEVTAALERRHANAIDRHQLPAVLRDLAAFAKGRKRR